jgi:hypothetical protein
MTKTTKPIYYQLLSGKITNFRIRKERRYIQLIYNR